MQSPFDQLAKGLMRSALSSVGRVHTQHEIAVDAQYADLWFEPMRDVEVTRRKLGLLGRMVASACILEPFHGTPGIVTVRSCVRKLFSLHHTRTLAAKRSGLSPPAFPRAWLISQGESPTVMAGFGLTPMRSWPRGDRPARADCLEEKDGARYEVENRADERGKRFPDEHPGALRAMAKAD